MNENTFATLITIFAILGLFFIADGITGMVAFDQYTRALCETDKDCTAPEVCCSFYQEKSGVCNDPKMCNSIYALRGEAKADTVIISVSNDKNYVSTIQFVIGLLMVIMIGCMLHQFNKQHSSKKHTT